MGSSPHARGLPAGRAGVAAVDRIIPARAGFTCPFFCSFSVVLDHPRTRGVYTILAEACIVMGGIIPARAGFTEEYADYAIANTDHPRTRGVYSAILLGRTVSEGSSPHARGLLESLKRFRSPNGIIPARAGFTAGCRDTFRRIPDHPRTRGVYASRARTRPYRKGSSPHARGLPMMATISAVAIGIIPARAGFTARGYAGGYAGPDHPRTRGVYRQGLGRSWCVLGSSPHARGLQVRNKDRDSGQRIIPARAGFTGKVCLIYWVYWDHPRTRGVYGCPSTMAEKASGSSPHARGLPFSSTIPNTPARIIPARAGFTRINLPFSRVNRDHPRTRGVYAD